MLALQNKYSAKMEFVIADTNTEDGSTLAGHYNVYYIPAVYILDGRGNILSNIPYSEINANPLKALDSYISRALSQK